MISNLIIWFCRENKCEQLSLLIDFHGEVVKISASNRIAGCVLSRVSHNLFHLRCPSTSNVTV